jgi:hypothetical protein
VAKCILIERTDDPSRVDWVPLYKNGLYQLIDRDIPYPERNLKASARFVGSLDEAGDLIVNHDYGIRMAASGKLRGNYICPPNLRVTWT